MSNSKIIRVVNHDFSKISNNNAVFMTSDLVCYEFNTTEFMDNFRLFENDNSGFGAVVRGFI